MNFCLEQLLSSPVCAIAFFLAIVIISFLVEVLAFLEGVL